MKKKFSYLLLSLLILPCLVLFSGCGETEPPVLTPLTESMITLDYTSTVYSGTEKTPAVTVRLDGQTVNADQYTVEYKNNINVGTARVIVKASEKSTTISGSASRTFSITRISKTVSNYQELKETLLDSNYTTIYCNGNISVPANENVVINEGITLNIGVFNLNNNGNIVNNGNFVLNSKPSGDGTLKNNGILTANIQTRQGLIDALTYANKIVLADTITGGVNTLERINIGGENKIVDVTIDLNGKNLETNIAVYGSQTHQVNVRITNSSSTPSTIGTESHNYGIIVLGNGNSNFNVQLNNLNFVGFEGGIATNGTYNNGIISATKCTFEGKNLGDSDLTKTGVGAYLPAKYGYTFKNCTFIGYTAYYTKSGTHGLTNCIFEAKGTTYHEPNKNGNGANPTGSALVIDSSTNYQEPLNVYVSGGTFKSECGYGVEEYATYSAGETKVVYSNVTLAEVIKFTTEKENYVSENNVIIDEIVEEEE
ncbi:MAG: hypothetical protein IJE91_01275 [Clostridia bacterium]|nr:hypothetical protein [Clostridia bacterium]